MYRAKYPILFIYSKEKLSKVSSKESSKFLVSLLLLFFCGDEKEKSQRMKCALLILGFCLLDWGKSDDDSHKTPFSWHWPESGPPFYRGQRPRCRLRACTAPQPALRECLWGGLKAQDRQGNVTNPLSLRSRLPSHPSGLLHLSCHIPA